MFPAYIPEITRQNEVRKIQEEINTKRNNIFEKYHDDFIKTSPLYQFTNTSYVYFVRDDRRSIIKIGQSNEVYNRVYNLFGKNRVGYAVIGLLKGADERGIHYLFAKFRRKERGELFEISGEIIKFLDETMKPEERLLVTMLNTLLGIYI